MNFVKVLIPSYFPFAGFGLVNTRKGSVCTAATWHCRQSPLAASTMESTVEAALQLLLDGRDRFDYAAVRALAAPVKPAVPELATPAVPDLSVYDALLAGVAR